MSPTRRHTGIPRGIEVARFGEEDAAIAAITYLAERDFPTEHLAIVGEGVLIVHDAQGRPSLGRAFLTGATSGVWVGIMGGLFAAFVVPSVPLSTLLMVSIVVASLILGLIRMGVQASGKGPFGGVAYSRRLEALTYVLVARARGPEAIRLLAERDGTGVGQPAETEDVHSTPPSSAPAPLTDTDGRPKYGVRRSDQAAAPDTAPGGE